MLSPKLPTAWLAAIVCLSPLTLVAALPPSETLLPDTTRGYLSVRNVHDLREQWDRTQLGELLNDPVMEPFVRDMQDQLRRKWRQSNDDLGITLDDFQQVPGGEVAVAVIHEEGAEPALVVLADVTDRHEEADQLIEKLQQQLGERSRQRRTVQVGEATVHVFTLKPREIDGRGREVSFVRDGDLMVVGDQLNEVRAVLERQRRGAATGRLADQVAFRAVIERCQREAGELVPDVRWFVDPLAFIAANRARLPERDRPRADQLAVLRKVGFDALQGAGGYVNVGLDEYDVLHRSSVYAPQPWTGSMNMVALVNDQDRTPPAWVPDELAIYASFDIDLVKAFDNIDPLFDEMFGEGEEGVWQDVLDSLKTDPNGPQIDLRNELVANLRSRATLITDYKLPIGPRSERMCLAVESSQPEALAETIRKSMETDPTVARREINGHVIWEIIEEPAAAPAPGLELPSGGVPPLVQGPGGLTPLAPSPPTPALPEEGERLLPRSAITVANGHLFVASHVDFLAEILSRASTSSPLAEARDFRTVSEHLDRLGGDLTCARFFVRQDEALRPNYELLRSGQMPQSETLIGSLLNRVLGDNQPGSVRTQQVDASQLPEYQVLRRYLGAAGAYVRTEDEGWLVVGFVLRKPTE